MKRALTAIVAAAGLIGCARDVPVYSPQPETVQVVPGVGIVYKQVWSDAEQLKLSWYIELADGTKPLDASWTRYEPRDSAECLKKNLDLRARVDMPEYGLAGWVDMSMEDTGCNVSVDSCSGTYTPDTGNPVDVSADVCQTADRDFAGLEEFVDLNLYNRAEQVGLWHNRKGLQ